jgi:hypothetical protein
MTGLSNIGGGLKVLGRPSVVVAVRRGCHGQVVNAVERPKVWNATWHPFEREQPRGREMTVETASVADYPSPDAVAARFRARRAEVEAAEEHARTLREQFDRDVSLFLTSLER